MSPRPRPARTFSARIFSARIFSARIFSARISPVRAAVAGLVALLLLGTLGAGAANGYWLATSTAPASTTVVLGSVGAGNTPGVSVDTNDVTVSWAPSFLHDGSDVQGYTVQRYSTANVLQTTLAGCAGVLAATSCTEIDVPDGTWTYAITPVFANWTGAQSAKSSPIRSDSTAPSITLTRTSTAGTSLLTGSTLYYRGAAAGSFTLTMTVSDAGSVAASARTTALTPTNAGWTHVPSSVNTPAGGPFVSNPFSWLAATTGTLSETVYGYDSSGNATTKTISLVDDSTGPTGGALSYNTGVQAATSLTITTGAVTDAGAGVSSRVLQRRSATLSTSTNTCGTWGSWATTKTSPAASYTQTVSNNRCYQYQYVLTDALGNVTTVAAPGTIKIRSYAAVINATSGILDYYRLGESSGTTIADSSTATTTNTGTLVNGVRTGAAGAILGDTNTAVSFDGVDDYAQIARGSTGSANFSIEFWFKSAGGLGTSSSWTDGAGLVDADTAGTADDFGVSLMRDGRICAGTGNPDTSACTTTTYADSAWHHVVFTRTATTKTLVVYVDGTSRATTTLASSAALTSSANIRFGSLQSGSNFFTGSLDEVAIYSSALSATTVSGHFQANQP